MITKVGDEYRAQHIGHKGLVTDILVGGTGTKLVPAIKSSKWNSEAWLDINFPVNITNQKETLTPEPMALDILFEDDHILVINKAGSLFSAPFLSFDVGGAPAATAIGDLNRDSRPDLVTVNGFSNTLSSLLGNGDGTSAARVDHATGVSPRAVVLAYVNDDAYLDACRGNAQGLYPLGYVPHNHHFLWFAATMEGASEVARTAAAHTGERTSDPQLMRTPGFEAMQNFLLSPLFAAVRFGRWVGVVAMSKPADDLPYMQAMWNYGQAMAAVSQGRLDDAKLFHAALEPAATSPVIEKMLAWDRYSLIGGVQIAERFAAASIARAEKRYDDAIAALSTAVTIEDTLPYDEPPGWNWPSRLALGNVLLDAGKAAEAEQAFRAELERNPENGWSLHGLARALKAQGKTQESKEVAERFAKAWANALSHDAGPGHASSAAVLKTAEGDRNTRRNRRLPYGQPFEDSRDYARTAAGKQPGGVASLCVPL